jgi:hypothetical protein
VEGCFELLASFRLFANPWGVAKDQLKKSLKDARLALDERLANTAQGVAAFGEF